MLTLTAEVKSESRKTSNEPILLIVFPNLGVRYSTRQYTWDTGTVTETFTEKLAQKASPSFTESTTELMNSLATSGRMTIRILDWQGSTRSELFTTSGDITDEPVEVWLKYNTASNLKSDATKIYEGKVVDYRFQRDVVTINIKANLPELDNDVLVESADYPEKFEPIQYGDFAWGGDRHLMFYEDVTPHFAQCRLVSYDDSKKTAKYIISGHEMHTLPTTNDINGNVFYVRDKHWVKLSPGGNVGDSFFTVGTKNYLTVNLQTTNPTAYGSLPKSPTQAAPQNTYSNWRNAVDGKSSTSIDVLHGEGTASALAVKNPKFSTIKNVKQKAIYGSNLAYFQVVIKFGVVDSNAFQVRITNGTYTVTYPITTADANSYKTYPFPDQIQTFDDADNTDIIVEWDGVNGNPGDACNVQGIIVNAGIEPPSGDEEFLYVRCIGKKFATDWGGRKTIGNAIDTASEAVEDLLRDAGYTNFITSTFDSVNTALQNLGIRSAFSIVDNNELKDVLRDICRKMHFSLQYTTDGWRLIHSYGSQSVFTASGASTPSNDDIFTDNATVSGGSFQQYPLLKPKFSRTRAPKDIFKVEFVFTHDGYIYDVSVGTGNNEEKLENPYLRDKSSALNFANEVGKLYRHQRMRVIFETFWDAIAFQIGDVINVRSVELNDTLLSNTVNNQKWLITEVSRKWRPQKITIKAVELI